MERSSFFNSVNGDRRYDMEEFALYFKQFLSTGIYHRDNVPALFVKASTPGLTTILEPGSAYIEGYMYQNTENKIFTHDTADITNPRIDRIVIRLDRSAAQRSIKAFIKKGVAAIAPVPPVLQRDDLIYEISVAQVRIDARSTVITSVKDERLDESVAGLVDSLISIPTDQFEQKWEQWFSKTDIFEDEWRRWFAGIQVQNPAMGGMKISVGKTPPASPITNDIWIDTR